MPDAKALASELDELVAAAGPPEIPKNLGNLPEDGDSTPPPQQAETPEDAEPARTPAPDPAPLLRDDPDEPAPARGDDAIRAELEALRREVQFFRSGTQPSAQAPPPPTLPFQVTDDDVNVILQGGPKAAQMMQNALEAVARVTREQTEQRLVQAYQQAQTQQASSTSLRSQFYGAHPELEPYYEVVGAQAQAVAQRMPYADAPVLLRETAKATREELRRRGITLQAAQAAPRREARGKLRPAVAEGGGSARGNGQTKLSPVEKDILQMFGAQR